MESKKETIFNTKELKKLQRAIVEAVVNSTFISGDILDTEIKDHNSLTKKIFSISKNFDIALIVDYRESILSSADFFLQKNKKAFAVIFYAMYFEHTINNILISVLQKNKITKESISKVIRSSMNAKFTWILELLALPKLNKNHGKIISDISEERNALIHYKFSSESADSRKDNLDKLLSSAKKTVAYVKKYESQILYRGKKQQLKKALREIPINS